MAIYTRKKYCPYCNSIYAYERRSTAKRNMAKYGSPIRQCPACKQHFIDREYREIAVQGFKRVDIMPITYSTMIYAGMFAFIALISLEKGGFGIFLFSGLSACIVYSDYSRHTERQEILEHERQASENRLKDPLYAAALENLGYDVPKCYLPTNTNGEK